MTGAAHKTPSPGSLYPRRKSSCPRSGRTFVGYVRRPGQDIGVLPHLGWAEALLRLALAAGLGGAIGIERELRDRYAGLRTHLLVSLGSALFTIVSAYAWTGFKFGSGVTYDPTRIAAQVVTGIGFLGAGAIMRQGVTVHGLTTAATLWMAAAIGMTAATGFYSIAVLATAVTLVVLWPLRIFERRFIDRMRSSSAHVVVDMALGSDASAVLRYLESERAVLVGVKVHDEAGERKLAADVELGRDVRMVEIINGLLAIDGVTGAQWVH
jgi:putative Mg2+ transporter-C (MgtC) family protein